MFFSLASVHLASKAPLFPPGRSDLLEIGEYTRGKSRQKGRSQRRSLRHLGTDDLSIEEVGLHLHEQIILTGSSVDTQEL